MNKVPHRDPIKKGEGPCKFVAGWNVPGQEPTQQPLFFEYFDDAKRYIINELGECEDNAAICNDENLAEEFSALRQDVNLESSPFTETINNYAYWVEVVK